MDYNKKYIAILGSTGSIGTQALEVVDEFPEYLEVFALTAFQNAELLIDQALKYNPRKVVIVCESKYLEVKEALAGTETEVITGETGLIEVVQDPAIDMVLTAMVGSDGLRPTVEAIRSGKDIALANKETLVVAGELVMSLAKEKGVRVLPVDSEHSAIFQCLEGERLDRVEKIILTASGGPFRGRNKEFLQNVSREDALKHPNWAMGAKITIDSATLMNKGLEVIEARWLFNKDVENIEVIVHPQSIIHSLVQFYDGSIKAQMGVPDMKLPIQLAFSHPERWQNNNPRFNFAEFKNLTFEEPDLETFRCLDLAYQALKEGGNRPCVMNAANEVAVAAFLKDEISFLQISDIIEETLCQVDYQKGATLEELIVSDIESKKVARVLINKKK